MKIVCFSDLHGQYSKKLTKWFDNNPGDILLFAGDLQLNNFDYGFKFLQWLNKLPYEYKIMIFGNHDGNYHYTLQESIKYNNIKILNNESITINNINIWGSPYSVQFGNWWFMKTDNELKEIYKSIPDNTNILLTHTPPFGILDKTISGANAGSKQLYNRILKLNNLKYHISAHIHEGYGIIKKNNITFINASVLNERYELVNSPIIFEI
jgi:Icc-related predicted phosphoesterase